MAPTHATAGPSRIKASSTQAPLPSPSVSAFNPSRTLFACAQPILGSAEKLSVWDIRSDRLIAEWEIEGASQATTVSWISLSSAGPSRKKRRKSEAAQESDEVVVVTTRSGSLFAFSPKRSEVVQRQEVDVVSAACVTQRGLLLARAKDLLYLSSDLSITSNVPLPPNTAPVHALAVLSTSTNDVLHVLLGAITSVISLHLNLSSGRITHSSNPIPVSTTRVTALYPLPTDISGASFLVLTHDDRTVSSYTLQTSTSSAKLSYRYASPTLSPAHSISVSSDLISVLHSSGEVSLFTPPSELDLIRPKTDSSPSILRVVEGKEDRLVRLCGVAFGEEDSSILLCGRMSGGGRVKWVKGTYELPEGGIRKETLVKSNAQDLVASGAKADFPTQRYTAPAPLEIPNQDAAPAAPLPADVDMADLTLGERLLALPNRDISAAPTEKAPPAINGPANAASLTRLLVQALHTSDPALLNLVISHRDPVLIRNTIRKMPPTLALPLLKACIERLGQGKGVNQRGGGRGAGQQEQQGRGTVAWIKCCLAERGSLLMAVSQRQVLQIVSC